LSHSISSGGIVTLSVAFCLGMFINEMWQHI
jgi:hypothetical protein